MNLLSILVTSTLAVGGPIGPSCPPAGLTRDGLRELKASGFEVADDERRNRLALSLLGCLGDPDPEIRDGVVFEGLSRWLRGKSLTNDTIVALEKSLRDSLTGETDPGGFRRPFAALVLSEVARADRIAPVFSDPVRADLVQVAAQSLTRVDDYRGFDSKEGWRHGVAHGADLALQLALNPRVDAAGLRELMAAVASQIAPEGPTFYTFGEPERLARAVIYAYRRNLLEPAFWQTWVGAIGNPGPLADWGSAFLSVEGLAKRHNKVAFLHALAFAGRAGGDEAGQRLAALADTALTHIIG